MSWRNIGIVYRKELVDTLRDRRTLISMIVIPVIVMPLLSIGMGTAAVKIVGRAQQEVPTVMVLGGEDSPKVMRALKQLETVKITPPVADYTNQISLKLVRAAAEIPPGFDAALERGETKQVQIYKYGGEMKSQLGADRLDAFFRNLRDATVRERLQSRDLPPNLIKPFEILQKNVAPAEKVSGNIIGSIIPYIIILLCLTGAMYPAMDLTAGEKERGTMETLLCSPVARTHIVLGKFFMVLTASLCTVLISLTAFALSFHFGRGLIGGGAVGKLGPLSLTVDPTAVLAVFTIVLPVAVLFSAVQLAVSIFAKSVKEAQSYLSPMMIIVIVPAVAGMLPGMELSARLALVPVMNTSLVSKEILSGVYHWNYIAMIFGSSCVYAGVALATAVKLFNREEVLFRS